MVWAMSLILLVLLVLRALVDLLLGLGSDVQLMELLV
jgi:hypothetical protein